MTLDRQIANPLDKAANREPFLQEFVEPDIGACTAKANSVRKPALKFKHTERRY
jgi:hypothetical protein